MSSMHLDEIIHQLERNRKVFFDIFNNLPSDFVTWKPNTKGWCVLEIVCHLIDEEIEDFRARVRHALDTPEASLIPIDPAGWPVTRNYMDRDFETSVKRLGQEREKSIAWLKGLVDPKWENAVNHPEMGKITAHSFLSNWLAHDYHHLRQINNMRYDYLKENSGDSLTYAGKW
ncbi:DinB family protein [Flagellimonas pacifica]|uniref:DinB superfamily protein n=1 Tax=Flagellimonas pacifica TaxID=1247520 RepID=A0A285N2L6_9FLAO|nr:DinB family protein [Allomuricauda parva]SNZ01981.1 DinB superfamily protein [Allomuricauda parva]